MCGGRLKSLLRIELQKVFHAYQVSFDEAPISPSNWMNIFSHKNRRFWVHMLVAIHQFFNILSVIIWSIGSDIYAICIVRSEDQMQQNFKKPKLVMSYNGESKLCCFFFGVFESRKSEKNCT